MSWNRILLPLEMDNCPDTIEIGNLGWEVYRREKEPAGFAMFHASILNDEGLPDRRVIYLSPVAASLCKNIAEKYPCEPCKAPARDEPNMAFVFGDPRMMGQLRDSVDTDALVVT
jgi:hypothetical protein